MPRETPRHALGDPTPHHGRPHITPWETRQGRSGARRTILGLPMKARGTASSPLGINDETTWLISPRHSGAPSRILGDRTRVLGSHHPTTWVGTPLPFARPARCLGRATHDSGSASRVLGSRLPNTHVA